MAKIAWENRKLHFFFLVGLFAYLIWNYQTFISVNWEHRGFLNEFDGTRCAISVGFFLISMVPFFRNGVPPMSYFITFLVQFFIVIPTLVLHMYMPTDVMIPIFGIQFVAMSMLLNVNFGFLDRLPRVPDKIGGTVLTLIGVALFAPFFGEFPLQFSKAMLFFSDSEGFYELRKITSQYGNTYTSYMRYGLQYFIFPAIMGMGVVQKRWWMVGTGIACMFLLYTMDPNKTLFFSVILIFFLAALGKTINRKIGWLIIGIIGVLLLGRILTATSNEIMLESIFVRRLLFLPAQITGSYFNYFANEPLHLSYSILGRWYKYSYELAPAKLMGEVIYGDPKVSANTGIIADGFMNFGYFGAFAFVTAAALIVKFVEYLRLHLIYLGLIFLIVWLFVNTGLLTAGLTHGLWAFGLIGLFFLRNSRAEHDVTTTVCHVSTVHRMFDDRIFYKQCVSLAKEGYDVHLVINHDKDEVVGGVAVHALGQASNRFSRMIIKPWRALRKVRKTKAEIVHFHDPELIPLGIWLRITGKNVIYDAHEHVPHQITSKDYIGPKAVRWVVAGAVRFLEWISGHLFNKVISVIPEIVERFPKPKQVLIRNVPILKFTEVDPKPKPEVPMLIYVGGISRIRGIKETIQSLEKIDIPLEFRLIGAWEGDEYEAECRALPGWSKVDYLGFMTLEEVFSHLQAADIGICLLAPESNYMKSLPVKAFEYMACQLPLIMSNFDFWKQHYTGCALFTDPMDVNAIANSIKELLSDPVKAKAMGQKGKHLAWENYSWEEESKVLTEVYREILKSE